MRIDIIKNIICSVSTISKNVTVTNVSCGPSVTRYELQPEQGEIIEEPFEITHDIDGLGYLEEKLKKLPKEDLKIVMEETGTYHLPVLGYLLDREYNDADYICITHAHYDHFSPEDIKKVFASYSEEFIFEDRREEDLGYVFFFKNDTIDKYVYCVEWDEFGTTYHRFTKKDYENLVAS